MPSLQQPHTRKLTITHIPKSYAAAVFDFINFRLGKIRHDPVTLLGERRKKS